MQKRIGNVLLKGVDLNEGLNEDESRNFGRELLRQAGGIPYPTLTPEETARVEGIKEKVSEILSTLSPREEKALRLHFMQELPYREVAQELGVSNINEAKKVVFRAKRKMRDPIRSRALRSCR